MQRRVLRRAHADGEQVGVESRRAHERQEFAAPGVDRDDGATPVGEQFGRELLQLEVDAEEEIGARCRTCISGQGFLQVTRLSLHMPATSVRDDMAVARMIQAGVVPITSMQYLLEIHRDWARAGKYVDVTNLAKKYGGAYGLGIDYISTMSSWIKEGDTKH